jgi:hypothetical protein
MGPDRSRVKPQTDQRTPTARSFKKKSAITLESQQHLSFSCFLSLSRDRVISAYKMMNRAKGPVWHKKVKR